MKELTKVCNVLPAYVPRIRQPLETSEGHVAQKGQLLQVPGL